MPRRNVRTDPRNPEIEAWLFAHDEETEFCLRLVLNGLSRHVRGDRRYQARLRELHERLCKTEDALVRYFRKSEAMRDTIVRALTEAQPTES